ncbi:MAG: hypothetical protein IKF11_09810 [Methanobrevibacter sp.]|nr:hypothetical protein [Methanobrevibacter sp.]
MECYYHPEREGTDVCAICGKAICKECGLEISGKIYCKECLEKIVGIGIQSNANQNNTVQKEPARLEKQEPIENIYQPQAESNIEIPQEEIKQIREDSPYNIKDSIEYTSGPDTSFTEQPQIAQNEYDTPQNQISQKPISNSQDYIYPDHETEPQPVVGGMNLEDKYEKYLDDLYFDEEEIPLGEQLAKDEAQYGSLTRKEYPARNEEPEDQRRLGRRRGSEETPEELEARIKSELMNGNSNENIHKINYKDEKEPMGAVDILLTIVLIIIILIVIYYLLYIFILNASYPTFLDAVYGLSNPQNVINNLLTH